MTVKILVFNGSNRAGSYSGKVANAALAELARQGVEATRIQLSDYPLPIMDEDLEAEKGIPENAYRLARLMAAHDGFFIATPEYNGSIPPLLKNVIDWVSRISRDGDWPGSAIRYLLESCAVAVCESASVLAPGVARADSISAASWGW